MDRIISPNASSIRSFLESCPTQVGYIENACSKFVKKNGVQINQDLLVSFAVAMYLCGVETTLAEIEALQIESLTQSDLVKDVCSCFEEDNHEKGSPEK